MGNIMHKYLVFQLHEPRWHGFAKWSLDFYVPDISLEGAIVYPLESGWTRRKRGARYAFFKEWISYARDYSDYT